MIVDLRFKAKYYMLQISCLPGGARKGDYYILNTLDEVKRALAKDLRDVYMAFAYEEDIFLYVIENDKLTSKIDLNPCISLLIENIYRVSFLDGSFCRNRLFYGPLQEDQDVDEMLSELLSDISDADHNISEDNSQIIINDDYRMVVDIRWPEIPIIQGNVTDKISVPSFWIDSHAKDL